MGQAAIKDHLPNVDIKDLPAPLQLGIPLAMSCSTEATFWGSDPSDLSKPDPVLGCHHSDRTIQKEVGDFVRDINSRYGLQYASDVVAYFRGSFLSQPFPAVERCIGDPPRDPNVYTDGDIQNYSQDAQNYMQDIWMSCI